MFCCALITVLTALVVFVWGVISAMASSGKIEGGADASTMHAFVSAQAALLSAGSAAIFKPDLTAALKDKNAPPVITLDDIKGKIPYDTGARVYRTSQHIGQRKLFLTELQFFIDLLTPDDSVVCVYAGAAPSNHTGMLSDLFPRVKFILVDPNPFDIVAAKPVFLHGSGRGKSPTDPAMTDERANALIASAVEGNARIYVINDLMTMEIARACAAQCPGAYFISDIRTNSSDGEDAPGSIDILWNLSQQYNWMCAMKPAWSMLKFRHPFYTETHDEIVKLAANEPYATDLELSRVNGIDFVANYRTNTLVYWTGKVNIQAFPGPSSTETRLITPATEVSQFMPFDEYESKLFWYNSIERCWRHHANPNASRADGFDHCNDCAIENALWEKYVRVFAPSTSVISYVKQLSHITDRSLIRGTHGRLFGQYDWGQLMAAVDATRRAGRKKHKAYVPRIHR